MCLQWQAHGNYAHPGDISDDLSPPGGRYALGELQLLSFLSIRFASARPLLCHKFGLLLHQGRLRCFCHSINLTVSSSCGPKFVTPLDRCVFPLTDRMTLNEEGIPGTDSLKEEMAY